MLRLAVAGSSTKWPKQWSEALHVSSNKTAVVTFLVDEWQRGSMVATPFSSPLVSSAGCFARVRVMAVQRFRVQELECSHEEADTLSMLPNRPREKRLAKSHFKAFRNARNFTV